MTKEQIAKHIAKKIYVVPAFNRQDLEDLILKELTSILHADKGRLSESTKID